VTLPVLTAVTGGWEARLVTRWERGDEGVRVVRRCVDLAELLAAAEAGLGRAAVLGSDVDRLDREAVRRLVAGGVAVVGLADPGDPEAPSRLRALGLTRTVPADAPTVEIAGQLTAAVSDLDSGSGRIPAPGAVSRRGRLVAVWGPTGAPGRTTVAIALAMELAASGRQVLLVDADTYGACVAQMLGLLDERAGLAAAVRAANQGRLTLDSLARLAPTVSPTLRVLTGVPRPQRWPELRVSGLEVVWDRARELAEHVVVDCAFALDADEEPPFDSAAPRRNQATVSALSAADDLVVVGAADPVGLQRLVRALQDVTAVVPGRRQPLVVVNRVRASAVGPHPERRIRAALLRYAGVDDAVLVPDDRQACDAAVLAGRALPEQAPMSPARLALAGLADRLPEAQASGPEGPGSSRRGV